MPDQIYKLDDNRVLLVPEAPDPTVIPLDQLNSQLESAKAELEKLLNRDDITRTRDQIADLEKQIATYQSAPDAPQHLKEEYA